MSPLAYKQLVVSGRSQELTEMSRTYSGKLEEQIEKYDLRYDESMENEFADDVQGSEDYLTTVQRIIGVI